MVPPYSFEELKRKVSGKDPLKIFLLYEGANTERYLINPLLSSNVIVTSRNIVFKPIKKEENDVGITDPFSLIKYANDIINNEIEKKNFISGRDKIMVVFDLDVLKNDQNKMNELLKLKTSDMILCYTNPSIELFMLLTIPNGYETIIEPNKAAIVRNDYNENGDRYVYGLLKESMPDLKDTKKEKDINFSYIISNIDKAFYQERFLNYKLTMAANRLTSNIAHVISKISNEDFDFDY